MQVPVATKVMVRPETLQTEGVLDARVTVFPVASVVGATVIDPVARLWFAGWAYVIVCGPRGVTTEDAPEALLVPPELVAVAVKVYGVPLVSPGTVHDPLNGVPEGLLTTQDWPLVTAVIVNDVGVDPVLARVTVTTAFPSPALAVGT